MSKLFNKLLHSNMVPLLFNFFCSFYFLKTVAYFNKGIFYLFFFLICIAIKSQVLKTQIKIVKLTIFTKLWVSLLDIVFINWENLFLIF